MLPVEGPKILIDPAAAPANGVQYIGFAQPNTSTDDPLWAIMRLTWSSSELAAVEWASGTNQFVKVWDDRASFVYS